MLDVPISLLDSSIFISSLLPCSKIQSTLLLFRGTFFHVLPLVKSEKRKIKSENYKPISTTFHSSFFSFLPILRHCRELVWWAMGDSNPRLSPCRDDTLPAELIARIFSKIKKYRFSTLFFSIS